jgi:type VI protein secretion system component VasF
VLPRLGEDALAVLRRNAAPDVVRRQDDPDGAHPPDEQAAKARHGGILFVPALVVSALVAAVVLAALLGLALVLLLAL